MSPGSAPNPPRFQQLCGSWGTQFAQDSPTSRLYASFDLFVHTGPFETFGQAVQEAMASGLPVVAPAAGGPLDLVAPARTGYLVSPNDGGAVAAAGAELAADEVKRKEYGAAARMAVEGRTWAAVGDELIDHYRAVLRATASEATIRTRPVSVQ